MAISFRGHKGSVKRMGRGQERGASVTTRRPVGPPAMADALLLGAAPGPRPAAPEGGAPAPPADAAGRLAAAGAGTGRSTFERTSSLGPTVWTRPRPSSAPDPRSPAR